MAKQPTGLFILRFNTADSYYQQFNGEYVAIGHGFPGTTNLEKAKIFYTVGSAKGSSFGSFCEIIPVSVTISGPPLP